jgi:hypothetical protein
MNTNNSPVMNTTNKWVYTDSLYPFLRCSRYRMHCQCCDRPILPGQYITRVLGPAPSYGVSLRPRKTSDGSTYSIETGDRWVHRDCDPGCWTEYSAELHATETTEALEKEPKTKMSCLFGAFGDHIINNYNDYYDMWE